MEHDDVSCGRRLATAMMRWSLAVDASEEVSEHEGATMMQQESPAAGERGGVAL